MVIFGAGASYDSVAGLLPLAHVAHAGIEIARPPLAAGLFDQRFGGVLDKHPDCAPLFQKLRRAAEAGEPIEKVLERFGDDAARNPDVLRQLLALRFYIRDAIIQCEGGWYAEHNGVTNYSELLYDIALWSREPEERLPVLYVTFNYDTLLEEGCRRAYDVVCDDFPLYVSDPRFKVFKAHGSVNWWRHVSDAGGFKQALRHAATLRWTDTYTAVGLGMIPDPIGVEADVVPAIAVPTAAKYSFECPPDHLRQLQEHIAGVTQALVIGWQGAEQHFLKMWRVAHPGPLERLCVVSGGPDQAARVLQNLRANGITATHERLGSGGFSAFLWRNELGEFLGGRRDAAGG